MAYVQKHKSHGVYIKCIKYKYININSTYKNAKVIKIQNPRKEFRVFNQEEVERSKSHESCVVVYMMQSYIAIKEDRRNKRT